MDSYWLFDIFGDNSHINAIECSRVPAGIRDIHRLEQKFFRHAIMHSVLKFKYFKNPVPESHLYTNLKCKHPIKQLTFTLKDKKIQLIL